LRLLMARLFFLDGSPARSPVLSLSWLRLDFAMTLPAEVSESALQVLSFNIRTCRSCRRPSWPISSPTRFVLPICLGSVCDPDGGVRAVADDLMSSITSRRNCGGRTHVYGVAILLVLMKVALPWLSSTR